MRHPSGAVALLLTPDGVVEEVLLDSLELGARAAQDFTSLISPGSSDKARRFLDAVRREHAAVDWELLVTTLGKTRVVRFSGVAEPDGLTVVGGGAADTLAVITEELAQIQGEQATLLRAALKELSSVKPKADVEVLDDLTRLNNELATAQRELAKKNAELARINAQKDQLLGMVAHDLRNPLTAISGFARLLEAGVLGSLTPKQAELAGKIDKSTVFMRALIDDLLDLSAIESGKVRLETSLVDLVALVEDAAETARLAASAKRIAVEVEAEGRVELIADERKLQQVVSNLLSNAVKYSWPDSRVRARVHARDAHARVEIVDEGQGIPPEEQTKLFRPFGRTSVRGTSGEKSTGLGLAIVRRIVEAHGGTIGVESEPGKGSTFFFELPRSE